MKVYVVSEGEIKEFLSEAHEPQTTSVWGTPIRYSEDRILAAFDDSGKAPMYVYSSLEDALQGVSKGKWSAPVFEVELDDACKLESSVNLDGKPNIYKLTRPSAVQRIIKGTHAGFTYCLDRTWEQKQVFITEYRKLWNQKDLPELPRDVQRKIADLCTLVLSLEGKISYQDLAAAIRATNQYLADPSLESLKAYQAFAKTTQGAPSPFMKKLGLCMLALGVAIAAGFGVIGLSVVAGGFGIFAFGHRVHSVSKAMNELSTAVVYKIKNHN